MLAPDPRFAIIDGLTGKEFELALVELFEGLGYDEVQRIGGYDKGADLTFVDNGELVAVQAKRCSSAVRIGAVRQLVDGIRRYECSRGILVTNSFFTEPAIECAHFHGIELWDRRMLAQYAEGDAPEVDVGVCAECGEAVSKGVTDWCLRHPDRYNGFVYCMKHQRRTQRHIA